MPSKYWIKLHQEILEDPKMGRLPDNLWRRSIELFLLAGELGSDLKEDDRGHLPATGEIAWRLRQLEERLEAELHQLAQVGILTQTETGWFVTNFVKRQKHVNPAERMKQYRERKREKELQNSDTKGVTYRNAEIEERKENTTPNGVGNKLPDQVDKPDGPKKQLMGMFNKTTNMQMPHRKTDVSFWWSSIGELYKMVNCDVDIGEYLIKQSVERMSQKGLDITSPNSILGYCRAILAEGNGKKKRMVIT